MEWQHLPAALNPVLIHIGPLQVRWYGLMYLVALTIVYLLSLYRIKKERYPFDNDTLQNYLIAGFAGLLIGAKLGYILFYHFGDFLQNPLRYLLPLDFSQGVRFIGFAGMSYHGGLLGVLAGVLLYQRWRPHTLLRFCDLIIPAIPLGYTFGRLGNFINGELYGRATSVPWGMYFPSDPRGVLRHPSQLYEALGEGILLFIILWSQRKRLAHVPGLSPGVYLAGYGVIRFFIEFTREPDAHLGFVAGPFSMGQVLCALMIAAGTGTVWWACARKRTSAKKEST